jgi:hypothetical protein
MLDEEPSFYWLTLIVFAPLPLQLRRLIKMHLKRILTLRIIKVIYKILRNLIHLIGTRIFETVSRRVSEANIFRNYMLQKSNPICHEQTKYRLRSISKYIYSASSIY